MDWSNWTLSFQFTVPTPSPDSAFATNVSWVKRWFLGLNYTTTTVATKSWTEIGQDWEATNQTKSWTGIGQDWEATNQTGAWNVTTGFDFPELDWNETSTTGSPEVTTTTLSTTKPVRIVEAAAQCGSSVRFDLIAVVFGVMVAQA